MKTAADLLSVLQAHRGRENGITAALLGAALQIPERQIRTFITALREEGVPICAHPALGYWIAVDQEEIALTCAFLRSRAMHSLVLEAKLRGIALADLVGQLRLPT